MISLLLGLSCAPEAPSSTAEPDPRQPLPAPALLRRMSLDLRGTLPSLAELQAVRDDPGAVDDLRDAFLSDERLRERLVSLFAERWHTLVDVYEINHYDYHLEDDQEYRFERAVGEEPLRLMAEVAVTEQHWSTIVTADWTMADPLMADLWPLELRGGGGGGWQVSRYTDGRPPAGVLATNGLWWRYVTNTSNANRSRAAAISRLLLCQDMLSRPVSFSDAPDLLDDEGTANALRENPSCVSCHASIEPIAATLFGFFWSIRYNPEEMSSYHAEREHLQGTFLDAEPAWFGAPLEGLVDLGPHIASDPRFVRCAAQSTAELLWRREAVLGDDAAIESLRQDFLAADQRLLPLIRAVTDTPSYRVGSFATDDDEAASPDRAVRMLSPDQLASAAEDLTGFSWRWQDFEQLRNDDLGYRILAGGVDGAAVASPQTEPSLSWSLVIQRHAQAAALFAVNAELVEGGPRRLFSNVTLAARPGDAAFDGELTDLHWRLYGAAPDADWLDQIAALWRASEALSTPEDAWVSVISVMLRDPAMVTY